MNMITLGPSSNQPRRAISACLIAALLLTIMCRNAVAGASKEKTVVGSVQAVSVEQRASQTVIYLRLTSLSRRVWAPENHGDNPNTIHKGERFRITYRIDTGEMTNRVGPL